MKHSTMPPRKPKPPPAPQRKAGESGSAFDLWLKRGLHELFDDVAREPIPEELMRLIEQDRADRKK